MTKEIQGLGLQLRDVVMCYGMSKMTVANEMVFKDVNPYLKLKFVEFLEFLGRVADFRFRDEDLPLYLKIEKILEPLMALIHV